MTHVCVYCVRVYVCVYTFIFIPSVHVYVCAYTFIFIPSEDSILGI